MKAEAGAPTMRTAVKLAQTAREFDGWSARGAQPASQAGARPRKARGPSDRKGAQRGAVAQRPEAPSRRSIPLVGETEKGPAPAEAGEAGGPGASPPRAMTPVCSYAWLARGALVKGRLIMKVFGNIGFSAMGGGNRPPAP